MEAKSKETPPDFRERFKLILYELQIKQNEFARSLGVSANYVYLLTSGRKSGVSEPLARLIEITYGYRAQWILTGEGEKKIISQQENLKNNTINRIRLMSSFELKAVAAFIRSLEEISE